MSAGLQAADLLAEGIAHCYLPGELEALALDLDMAAARACTKACNPCEDSTVMASRRLLQAVLEKLYTLRGGTTGSPLRKPGAGQANALLHSRGLREW